MTKKDHKGYYHPNNGYWETTTTPSIEILSEYPEGTVEIDVQPSEGYTYNGLEWIAPTEEWIFELTSERVRLQRRHILTTQVDPVVSNPLRWASFSETKQTEWTVYRQALLDIPNQNSFPSDVTWPTPPE